jgi:hypothetical protein
MVDNRRELHFLIPDRELRRCLVTAAGALPSRLVTPPEGESTVIAAAAATMDVAGAPLPIVEIHFDYERDPDAGPVPVLVRTESAPDGPPAGLDWFDLDGRLPVTDPGLTARLEELIVEWRSNAEPPPLRPRWSRPEWHARATAWLVEQLERVGRPPMGPVEQVRHWGISALMRVPTAGGPAWFKAVFPPFHHEPAVTRLLADAFPGEVPVVLATEPDEGWLVTHDLGTVAGDADETALRRAAAALARIQLAMVDRTAEILALGCPRRPLRDVPGSLAALFDESPRLPGVPAELDTAALVERVAAAVNRVQALGVADSLIHGDFHGGNVATVEGRAVVYDWSDAAVGNPLVDLVTWPGSWFEPSVRLAARTALLDAWAAAGIAEGKALHDRLEDLVTVGAAYQTISYGGITRNLEPSRRLEMGDGIDHFARIAAGSEPD